MARDGWRQVDCSTPMDQQRRTLVDQMSWTCAGLRSRLRQNESSVCLHYYIILLAGTKIYDVESLRRIECALQLAASSVERIRLLIKLYCNVLIHLFAIWRACRFVTSENYFGKPRLTTSGNFGKLRKTPENYFGKRSKTSEYFGKI